MMESPDSLEGGFPDLASPTTGPPVRQNDRRPSDFSVIVKEKIVNDGKYSVNVIFAPYLSCKTHIFNIFNRAISPIETKVYVCVYLCVCL